MKTLIVTILVLFSSFLSYSQNPYQIVDSTKQWSTVYVGFWAFMVAHCSTAGYQFHDEVQMGEHTYLKVWEATDSLQSEWVNIGYIREDTTTGKVYFGTNEDGMLYDFNLVEGDSVYISNYYLDFSDVLMICDSIDTISINGSLRQRYHFTPGFGSDEIVETWIEGIGSEFGVLNSGYVAAQLVGGVSELLCHYQDNELIYQSPKFDSCYYDDFYPKIITEDVDTAYMDTYYEFQLELSDTTNIDSVYWYEYSIPAGFSFDRTTGTIYGMPADTGSDSFAALIYNGDIGYITDILIDTLVIMLPTNMKENSPKTDVMIYPNPCSGAVFIEPGRQLNSKEIRMELINYAGAVLQRRTINQSQKLNTISYPEGIYILVLKDLNNKVITTKKLIIDHNF
ncbi:MAG: T9SS type A sorting domain-containing protein [Bacteroidales bacterium]|nr:T9SS type A sorting domain-containing protein [Bacteroidales bacterium]